MISRNAPIGNARNGAETMGIDFGQGMKFAIVGVRESLSYGTLTITNIAVQIGDMQMNIMRYK